MVCRLCLLEKELQRSHIIPEFLYKPIYEDHHKFMVLTSNPQGATRHEQKGLRERLLCENCEGIIQKFEDYAARLLFQNCQQPTAYDNAKIFHGIDYKRFKLFQLSLIWRLSISSLDQLNMIKIGLPNSAHPLKFTKHEERIRQMLWTDSPGEPSEYGCVLFFSSKVKGDLNRAILLESAKRFNGHRIYPIYINGIIWMYIISSHTAKLGIGKHYLQKDGTLPVIRNDELLESMLYRYGRDMRMAGKM